MPPAPPTGAPNCIAKLEFISHNGTDGCRGELNRIEFSDYLVGEGKGPDGVLPEMFTESEKGDGNAEMSAFGQRWIRGGRVRDRDLPGYVEGRWTLHQAWCVEVLRRDMPMEPRHFRLILSPAPDIGRRTDLREFTRAVMERVEQDNFRKLYWVASEHHNSDVPHVHVGIRGMDTEAKEVFFAAQYVRLGFKYRAREILNEAFGSKKVRNAG